MATVLLIIDIQNDYFPGGAHPLVGPEKSATRARVLLDGFRAAALPVVHIQHIADAPDATFMRPGTDGAQIHPLVHPNDGEAVVSKAHPNSFLDTGLRAELDRLEADTMVVAGMMSSMCVDATVRAASDLGYRVVLAHDACAAPDLEFGGTVVPGLSVHAAFMAALAATYAEVVTAEQAVAALASSAWRARG